MQQLEQASGVGAEFDVPHDDDRAPPRCDPGRRDGFRADGEHPTALDPANKSRDGQTAEIADMEQLLSRSSMVWFPPNRGGVSYAASLMRAAAFS
jgi:hypothetical protein